MAQGDQFGRRVSLLLQSSAQAPGQQKKFLDLSEFHIKFQTAQQDEESPNDCRITVFNLSAATMKAIREEYSEVILQAGYENAAYGVIFQGTIKQFRRGRSDNKTTYLEILACDGDIAYNWAVVKKTLDAASSDPKTRVMAAIEAMEQYGVVAGNVPYTGTGGTLPRGKVLFGYAKAQVRSVTRTTGATWNIQNGVLNITPFDNYLPGEAVVLNSATGLIGRAEQTGEGICARVLLNPKITIGGTVRIDQASINQTEQQRAFQLPGMGQQPFDKFAGVQFYADVSADGLYRVYVAEHTGDTRGRDWYTDLVCLTVDPTTGKVVTDGR